MGSLEIIPSHRFVSWFSGQLQVLTSMHDLGIVCQLYQVAWEKTDQDSLRLIE